MAYYIAPYQEKTLNAQSDPSYVASNGIATYRDAETEHATDLANMETLGYMHRFIRFVTNGYHGEGVRGVIMNGYNQEFRGPMQSSARSLDLAVDGHGWLVVDSAGSVEHDSVVTHGFKATGSFQIDATGCLHDEAGNYLMGVPTDVSGNPTKPFSLLAHLERVQLPLTPSEASPTANIQFHGILPAEIGSQTNFKSNAVDVFDSMGVVHQLDFEWDYLGPRLWKFSAQDSNGATLKQGTTQTSWADGVIVGFTPNGTYGGTVLLTQAEYTTWLTAHQEDVGAEQVMDKINEIMEATPSISLTDFKSDVQDFTNTITAANFTTGAGAINTAVQAITTTTEAAVQAAQAALVVKQTAEQTALTALQAVFSATTEPPTVTASLWQDDEHNLIGSAESIINLDISKMLMMGGQFNVQTPSQDGTSSTSLKDIRIDSNGVLSFEFINQETKAGWLIPLINYYNNNGLAQGNNNVLTPQPECGDYVLAAPQTGVLGKIHDKMLIQSNVQPQETLMLAHKKAVATQDNATIYKIITQVESFLLQIFAQL
jgi:flagellar hook protein FlgE